MTTWVGCLYRLHKTKSSTEMFFYRATRCFANTLISLFKRTNKEEEDMTSDLGK